MNTFEALKSIIVDKLGVDENEVTPEASFTNDLGADSFDRIDLLMDAELYFVIGIPDSEAETIETVGDAVRIIESKLIKKK